MRLSQEEVKQIKQTFSDFLDGEVVQVFLYGSRTHDALKGGDIDLIWVVPEAKERELNIDKYKVLAALKTAIGDQKIDLGILSQTTLKNHDFYAQVIEEAIQL